jgi:raffinose/stachyose/melibiose transport system substrate-binding protein
MKRTLCIILAIVLLFVFAVACGDTSETPAPPPASGSGTSDTPAADAPTAGNQPEPSDGDAVTLHFMLNSPELTEYYNNMAEAYNRHTGGRVTIEMFIEQNDYQTLLMSRLNQGRIPDMFMSSAYAENMLFRDFTYDLTNEPFMAYIDPNVLNSVTVDGEITGYPFVLQSHAYIYNIDLFEQAGITTLPETLEQLREVCETLEAAGIQPFASGFAEWWVLPQTVYPSMSDVNNGDFEGFFADIANGTTVFGDLPELDFALDVLDLINEFSGNRPMESTFDDQVGSMANGTVAMIHQGNWAEDSIRSANPDIRLGYVLHPRLDGKAVLAVESNLTFRIGRTENLQETLMWLDWLTTSDFGRSWIPEQIKQMSPQIGAAMPDSMLAEETAKYLERGQAAPWWIFTGPEGIEEPFGRAFQAYVAGTATRDQLRNELNALFR